MIELTHLALDGVRDKVEGLNSLKTFVQITLYNVYESFKQAKEIITEK